MTNSVIPPASNAVGIGSANILPIIGPRFDGPTWTEAGSAARLVGPDGTEATAASALGNSLAGNISTSTTVTQPLNTPNGGMAAITLNGDTAIVFPEATAGQLFKFRLAVAQNATGFWFFTLPSSVSWITGTRPIPPSRPLAVALYDFYTIDGGTTWQAASVANPTSLEPLVYDDFLRANSASSLGSALTGEAWTAHTGTWGVIANLAYCSTRVGDSVASVDAENASMDVRCVVTTGAAGSSPCVVVRVTDDQSYLVVILAVGSAGITLWQRVAGAYTNLVAAVGPTIAEFTAYKVRVRCSGTTIETYVDDVLVNTRTGVTAQQTATRAGIRINDDISGARWDNFVVTVTT
jgi:hypothetical protein